MDTKPRGDGGSQLPVDPPQSERAGELTRYMVLFAPVPDEGDPIKWRELGWYYAHNRDSAKLHGRDDKESGLQGQLLDIAAKRGLRLKAIPERSWPEDDEVYTQEQPPPEWATKSLGDLRRDEG